MDEGGLNSPAKQVKTQSLRFPRNAPDAAADEAGGVLAPGADGSELDELLLDEEGFDDLDELLDPEAAVKTDGVEESAEVKQLRERMVESAKVEFADGAPPIDAGPRRNRGERQSGGRDDEAYGSFGGRGGGGGGLGRSLREHGPVEVEEEVGTPVVLRALVQLVQLVLLLLVLAVRDHQEIGRASCRERV